MKWKLGWELYRDDLGVELHWQHYYRHSERASRCGYRLKTHVKQITRQGTHDARTPLAKARERAVKGSPKLQKLVSMILVA